MAWVDYDNDGDLDLLVIRYDAAVPLATSLYLNNAGAFQDAGPAFVGVASGPDGAAWGDYDDDGDPDLALLGRVGVVDPYTKLYRNEATAPNTPPTAPTGLALAWSGSVATFNWDAATDAQTPEAGLTYNLRIGSGRGADDLFVCMSDPATGHRLVPARGNVGRLRQFSLDMGAVTEFYWTVQAVDGGLAGSPFAPERSSVPDGFVESRRPSSASAERRSTGVTTTGTAISTSW